MKDCFPRVCLFPTPDVPEARLRVKDVVLCAQSEQMHGVWVITDPLWAEDISV